MNKQEAVVILGTAHLITIPGKGSPDGSFREAIYSREIVSRVKKQLEDDGFIVLVDYEPLEPNASMKASSSKEMQNKELAYRVKFVNGVCKTRGSRNCLYVPIHVNAAGNGKNWMSAGGWCCYTSVGQTRGDKLADFLHQAATENLKGYEALMSEGKKKGWYDKYQRPIRTDLSDDDPDQEANFYVLKNTNCAACLTENFFQDNKSDVAFLNSEEGKEIITRIHVQGIENYVASL